MTQRAEVPAVIAKLKARTDKFNAEFVEPALEGSQKDQWQQDHWTKATSTTTALV